MVEHFTFLDDFNNTWIILYYIILYYIILYYIILYYIILFYIILYYIILYYIILYYIILYYIILYSITLYNIYSITLYYIALLANTLINNNNVVPTSIMLSSRPANCVVVPLSSPPILSFPWLPLSICYHLIWLRAQPYPYVGIFYSLYYICLRL